MTKKNLQRISFLALATLAFGALAPSAASAQEKSWSLDVSVDYFDHYMFRGVPLLGDNEVLNPHVTYSMGNFNAYYYGYFGDVPADFTFPGQPASSPEDTFGTHYPFARDTLQALVGPEVKLVDTGEPVARQARRLLEAAGLLDAGGKGAIETISTGDLAALQAAVARWL